MPSEAAEASQPSREPPGAASAAPMSLSAIGVAKEGADAPAAAATKGAAGGNAPEVHAPTGSQSPPPHCLPPQPQGFMGALAKFARSFSLQSEPTSPAPAPSFNASESGVLVSPEGSGRAEDAEGSGRAEDAAEGSSPGSPGSPGGSSAHVTAERVSRARAKSAERERRSSREFFACEDGGRHSRRSFGEGSPRPTVVEPIGRGDRLAAAREALRAAEARAAAADAKIVEMQGHAAPLPSSSNALAFDDDGPEIAL
eukprot:Transcript_1444.p2 GENE.Transcript_1444~~Transcript_1444.p2  ORF type:complete len:256 (-),score=32.77 Transcript_1444:89-856(-)